MTFTKQLKDRERSTELFNVLDNAEMHKAFRDYCAAEFSLENILFYEDYIKLDTSKHKLTDMKKMFHSYVSLDAFFALNITKEFSEPLRLALEKEDETEALNALGKVKKLVDTNMQDTLYRFSKTKTFREWRKATQTSKNVLATLGFK